MPALVAVIVQRLRPSLVLTPQALIDQHLQGVPLVLPTGQPLSADATEQAIEAAQLAIEHTFHIKLVPQVVQESRDLERRVFLNHGYLKTQYPVVEMIGLAGGLGNGTKTVIYPRQWLTTRQTTDGFSYERSVSVVPNGNASLTGMMAVAFTSLSLSTFARRDFIPHYWQLTYKTGLNPIPADLIQLLGRRAALAIYYQLAGVVIGAGLASTSISLDGLSQSVSASNPYSAVIRGYEEAIKASMSGLQSTYGSFELNVL
jgi:hypothetical protein